MTKETQPQGMTETETPDENRSAEDGIYTADRTDAERRAAYGSTLTEPVNGRAPGLVATLRALLR